MLEAVEHSLKRLYPRHHSLLTAKKLALEAGIAGEDKLAETLRKHAFPFEHRIFHDLSLKSSSSFQIDSLFLTPFYSVVIEVKNISGVLRFVDDPPQLVRTRDSGEVDGFESPAAQVERNGDLLNLWLHERGIRLPIYRIVVLAYPKQIVEQAPAKTKILFPSLVPSFLRSLPRKSTLLDVMKLGWLTEELLKSHRPFVPRPLGDIYDIPGADYRTGVMCLGCGTIGMLKIKRSWHCVRCSRRDPSAHEQAVREWFLLIGREMRNEDCRGFLHVDMHTASRILRGMNLESKGSFKDRTYQMKL